MSTEILSEKITSYASYVRKMLSECIWGLEKRNFSLLTRIMNEFEDEANSREIDIEKHCIDYITESKPGGEDLRLVLMVMKMNDELERMADHVVNIAEAGLFLVSESFIKPLIEIPRMGHIASEMIEDCMIAFSRKKTKLARRVLERDDELDDMAYQKFNSMIEFMREYPETIKRAQRMIHISNNLERIGDLATNLAEEIIYIYDGEIIKHNISNKKDNEMSA
ncbi:MAG: phosphate signaling complex protein PhoU [Candidatus Muiribacteriaceae bacterium]